VKYRLHLSCFNGMSFDLVDRTPDEAECRRQAASEIRYHRNVLESPVTILDRGRSWELGDPGDRMVADHDGVLSLDELEYPQCDRCGDDIDGDVFHAAGDRDFGSFCCETCAEQAWHSWDREMFEEELAWRLNRSLTRDQLLEAVARSWPPLADPDGRPDGELAAHLAATTPDREAAEELLMEMTSP
jgi:hypothetical protein